MKVALSWLKTYIDCDATSAEIATYLTNTGLEVGGIEPYETIKGGLQGLVVGEVLQCEQHPNADRLKKTLVNVGDDTPLEIVCGAPNVAAGQKVVVATVGTELHPISGESFKIKKGKIRGEVSNGMLCAEDEIGLGEGHDGIMVLDGKAVPGTPMASYLKIENDEIIEIDLTPNRSDAISHLGVARDLLAALKAAGKADETKSVKWPDVSGFKVDQQAEAVKVELKDTAACPRYSGLTIEGVTVTDSPDWLQQRLKSIGLSPINNVVDVTNFVLHEMGQPLHAFDASKISGNKVVVKKLAAKTTFTTLDEVERKLDAEDLMICNEQEGMCIAGVFGGIQSGVTGETTRVFLESAYFEPAGIRKTARRHGLSTDASFRYERGTDPEITVYALKRAASLIKEVAGGKVVGDIIDLYPEPIKRHSFPFYFENCSRIIGQELEPDRIKSILNSLDIEVDEEHTDRLVLTIPSYRTDVTREIDVIEEVLRIHGYNNIDLPTSVRASLPSGNGLDSELLFQKTADLLSASGLNEVMSNSLTKSAYYKDEAATSVAILNPLSSELDVMRQSMAYGMLETLRYNFNRKQSDFKAFEFGKTYHKRDKGYEEKRYLAIMISGKSEVENWNAGVAKVSFFDLKQLVNKVLQRLGIAANELNVSDAQHAMLDYGLTYSTGNKTVVNAGKLSAAKCKAMEVEVPVFYAELDWDALVTFAMKQAIQFMPLPKYPTVRRDLALLLDESVRFEQLEQIALQTDRKLLKKVGLFDVYKGKDLEKGKQSYALSFLFRSDEKTLKDKQVDQSIKRIYEALNKETGAVLRQGEI
jgi:phenylalanyl-tRNA synthetase beta chain